MAKTVIKNLSWKLFMFALQNLASLQFDLPKQMMFGFASKVTRCEAYAWYEDLHMPKGEGGILMPRQKSSTNLA